jgi:hypothetical protein
MRGERRERVGHLTSLSDSCRRRSRVDCVDRTAWKRVLGRLTSIQALFSIWDSVLVSLVPCT